MDFTFSDEQRMMAASVRELLADVCSPAVLRARGGGRDDARARRALGALRRARDCRDCSRRSRPAGWVCTSVDFVLIAEEIGRAAVPEALVEHAAVGGAAARRARRDPRVAAGARGGRGGSRARGGRRCRRSRLSPAPARPTGCCSARATSCTSCRDPGVRLVEQPANDRLRRLHRVAYAPRDGDPDREGCRRRGRRWPAPSIAARCTRRRNVLASRERMLEIGVAYAQRAQAVRPADRRLPGGQAPVRECAGQARVRAPGRLRRRGVARGLGRDDARWPFRTPSSRPSRPRTPARESPCRRTARWATPGRSTCTST